MNKMLLKVLSIVLVLLFASTTVAFTTVAVTGIKLDSDKVALKVGSTIKPVVTFSPANATNKKMIYSTSNKNVATVDTNGVIKGVKAGSAVITFTSSSNNKAVAKVNVTVVAVDRTPVKLRILTPDAMEWNNFPNNPVAQEIKKQLGLTIEFVEADTDKMRVLTASGDLPDILNVRNTPEFQMRTALIQGKKVIPLDDLLPLYGQDIIKNASTMLNFSKKFWSADQNKTYAVSQYIGGEFIGAEPGIGTVIRWDYYKELGAPTIKTPTDLLNVLDQMVKKHPTTADGKKTYGYAIFNDWGSWCYPFITGLFNGGDANYDIKNNMPIPYYSDPNGPYWQGAKFLYEANKRGLLDPDSLIMGYNDLEVKMTNGTVFSTVQNWSSQKFNSDPQNIAKAAGYQVIPVEGARTWYNSVAETGWTERPLMVSKNCKYPARAVEFLNWLYSADGLRTIFSGVKGQQWDVVNGKPALKKAVIDAYAEGGDAWKKLQISGKSQGIGNLAGLSGTEINPKDGAPYSLLSNPEVIAQSLSPLQKDLAAYYKASYPGEVIMNLVKKGKMYDRSTDHNSLINGAKATEPKEISLIGGKLDSAFMQGVPKCILAKTDAEFTENMNKVISDINALGYEKYFAWQKQAWIDAKKAVGVK